MTVQEQAEKIRMDIENYTQEQICGWVFYPELEAIIALRIHEVVDEAKKELIESFEKECYERCLEHGWFYVDIIQKIAKRDKQ